MRLSRRLILVAAALLMPAAAHAGVRLEKGWSRPAPAGLSTGVGYGVLHNDGAAPDRLLSASSPAAARVELHESMETRGPMGPMSHMAPLAGLDVPPHGDAVLAPGGRHLMLVGLRRPLRDGERVPVTLTFQRAGKVAAELQVRPTAP
ncbi:MAG: copper chaperone PCu(A)C [Caulobacteraceae bacterium]|nr:copper chaperone PCu(A)C [Caulobacter sp.]